jgi:hypothetical protein
MIISVLNGKKPDIMKRESFPHQLVRGLATEDAKHKDFGRRHAIGEPKNPLQRLYAEAFDRARRRFYAEAFNKARQSATLS